MAEMHEIDYKIFGEEMQFVEVELDPQEAVVAEAGGMMYMEEGIEMETIFGDGSQQNSGFLGSLMSAGKRLLTGESLFMTVFLNRGSGKQRASFGAPYPGKIIPVHLTDVGGELIAQKDSFLCAAKGVSIGIAFQKRLGAAPPIFLTHRPSAPIHPRATHTDAEPFYERIKRSRHRARTRARAGDASTQILNALRAPRVCPNLLRREFLHRNRHPGVVGAPTDAVRIAGAAERDGRLVDDAHAL